MKNQQDASQETLWATLYRKQRSAVAAALGTAALAGTIATVSGIKLSQDYAERVAQRQAIEAERSAAIGGMIQNLKRSEHIFKFVDEIELDRREFKKFQERMFIEAAIGIGGPGIPFKKPFAIRPEWQKPDILQLARIELLTQLVKVDKRIDISTESFLNELNSITKDNFLETAPQSATNILKALVEDLDRIKTKPLESKYDLAVAALKLEILAKRLSNTKELKDVPAKGKEEAIKNLRLNADLLIDFAEDIQHSMGTER